MKGHQSLPSLARWLLLLAGLLLSDTAYTQASDAVAPVATFDFAIAETLNAMGHPPTAMSGLQGYETYMGETGIFPQATTSLGTRFQPNLELLASQQPQHILIWPPAHVNLIPKLSRIAEVRKYHLYNLSPDADSKSAWQILVDFTRELGELVDDRAAAERLIERTRRHLNDLKARLDDHEEPLLLARLIDARHIRIYGSGNVPSMVLQRLGLDNAWQGQVNQWGFTTLEASAVFDIDARLILLESSHSPAGTQQRLLSQGLWRYWPSAQRDDWCVIATNNWAWGGLPAARRFADTLVTALEEEHAH